MGLNKHKKGMWIAVSAGKLRQRSNVDDKDATKRTIELRDGTEKVVYERVYDDIDGRVTGFTIRKGDYGRQWILTITDGNDTFNLTFAYDSKYIRTLFERLPNIDFEKNINLRPYSFENEKKKRQLGITVKQDDKKIPSFYREYDPEGKMIGWLHKIPEPPEYNADEFNENEFKKYIINVMEFFEKGVDRIQEKIVEASPVDYELPESEKTMKEETDKINYEEKSEDDDLPF